MIQKGAPALAVLALLVLVSTTASQTNRPAQTNPSTSSSIPATAASASAAQPKPGSGTPNAVAPAGSNNCFGGNCDAQMPHISISTPAPAPAPWLWQEKVSWAANLVLVVLGYVAILMALSLLRKIERQTHFVEEAAQAATESARAALMHAEAAERAERPWILISARAAPGSDTDFTVSAMNRGRGPARIISMIDQILFATDESHLDPTPVFKGQPAAPEEPIVLLPGESIDLASFSRGDVSKVCVTPDRLKRIESWEEKLFLCGKVAYIDLAAPDLTAAHQYESSWLCWYIHGRQKSGMVMAGPPSYNRHT